MHDFGILKPLLVNVRSWLNWLGFILIIRSFFSGWTGRAIIRILSFGTLVDLSSGWDKVFYFLGYPFIHPNFCMKQNKINATFLGVSKQFKTFWNKSKIGNNLISQGKIYETGRNFLSQEEIHWHKNKFIITGRNIKVYESISCDKKKFPATGWNLLSQEGFLKA